MAKDQPSKMRKKIHDLCEENEYYSIKQNRNRARSITVGTAFGGVVEVNMRSDAASVYAQMQPTETIELIEQLAAGVGVEIAMRPKQNFSSWRGWEEVIGQKVPLDKIAWKGASFLNIESQNVVQNRLGAEKESEELEERLTKKSRKTRKKVKETETENE